MNFTTQSDPLSLTIPGTRRSSFQTFLRWLMAIAGLVALVAAGTVSSSGWERALGREAGSLSWGPSLFRGLLVWHALALLVAAVRAGHDRRVEGLNDDTSRWLPASWTATALGLGLMIMAGLILRLIRLDSCLWLDEVLTMVRFAQVPLGTVVTTFPDQNQHMLYSILAHLSLALFGDSAWAFRVPAVVFGVLSIPVLFLLADQVASRREAWLASLLLTVSYHHIWFSQNARGYTGLLLFSMLTTWLFLIGIRRPSGMNATSSLAPPPRWVWPAYALATVGGWWVHLTMLFVTLAQGLVWLVAVVISRRRACDSDRQRAHAAAIRRWPPVAYLLAGTLTLQVYSLSLPEFLSSAFDAGSLHSIWMEPWWVIRSFIDNLQVGFGGKVGLLGGGLLFATGMFSLARRSPELVAIFLVSTFSALWVMVALEHNLWPRFFFFAMGFMIIIVVRGAFVWGELPARWFSRGDRSTMAARFGSAAVMAMILLSLLSLPRLYRHPKQDYASAKEFVLAHRTNQDAVASTGLAALTFQLFFAPDWAIVETSEQLNDLRANHRRVWLVYTFPPHMMSTYPDVWRVIEEQGGAMKSFAGSLQGGDVYVSLLENGAFPNVDQVR
jgi:mannosyltransferase